MINIKYNDHWYFCVLKLDLIKRNREVNGYDIIICRISFDFLKGSYTAYNKGLIKKLSWMLKHRMLILIKCI